MIIINFNIYKKWRLRQVPTKNEPIVEKEKGGDGDREEKKSNGAHSPTK